MEQLMSGSSSTAMAVLFWIAAMFLCASIARGWAAFPGDARRVLLRRRARRHPRPLRRYLKPLQMSPMGISEPSSVPPSSPGTADGR